MWNWTCAIAVPFLVSRRILRDYCMMSTVDALEFFENG